MGFEGCLAVDKRREEPAVEAALLRAARAGDRAALERLVSLHKRSLFALCHGMLGHPDDAEDAVQETFLRALRALPSFREKAAFRTWLHRIAVNVCLHGRASRRPAEPWDEERARLHPAICSPEQIALQRLQMLEALATLRPQHRAVLLLKELEGWTVGEIGAALGWSPKRVENVLYRARCALIAWRRRTAGEGGNE